MPEVFVLKLDKERSFKFNSRAIGAAEAELGKGLAALFSEDQIGVRVVAVLFTHAARVIDPKMTTDKMYDILDTYVGNGGKLTDLVEKLGDQLGESLGKDKQGNPEAEA